MSPERLAAIEAQMGTKPTHTDYLGGSGGSIDVAFRWADGNMKWLNRALELESARADRWRAVHELYLKNDGSCRLSKGELRGYIDRIDRGEQ